MFKNWQIPQIRWNGDIASSLSQISGYLVLGPDLVCVGRGRVWRTSGRGHLLKREGGRVNTRESTGVCLHVGYTVPGYRTLFMQCSGGYIGWTSTVNGLQISVVPPHAAGKTIWDHAQSEVSSSTWSYTVCFQITENAVTWIHGSIC